MEWRYRVPHKNLGSICPTRYNEHTMNNHDISLTKGLEIEQFIGFRSTGQVIPRSAQVHELDSQFTLEPDGRNVEFATVATTDYRELMRDMLDQRNRLRAVLAQLHPDYTIVPGSTIGTQFHQEFQFSDPDNPYYRHIAEKHKLSILTASVHYNLGMPQYLDTDGTRQTLVHLCNMWRTEAPLILAMTASSPFLNGAVTGEQSSRWLTFPPNPPLVPLWENYDDYLQWNCMQVAEQTMYNPKHLWLSVRPNGPNKPDSIDRLEVRIADASTDWSLVMAIMYWIELRTRCMLDYLAGGEGELPHHDGSELLTTIAENEFSAATHGVSGHFSDWFYAEETTIHDAIERRLADMESYLTDAALHTRCVSRLRQVLSDGSESTKKLHAIEQGFSVQEVVLDWIEESAYLDSRQP